MPTRELDEAGPRRRWLPALLIGMLLACLGFALAIQVRSTSSTDSLTTAREEDLVRILDDQNSRIDRVQQQIDDLQTAKNRLSASDGANAAAREEARRQDEALAILVGSVPAHGPGVAVAITDPAHALVAEDLLDVLEELRGAGAEVIQFDSVRVSTSSAFTSQAGQIFLDGTVVSAPYAVLAIGQPATMDTALNIQGGVVQSVSVAGGKATVRQSPDVSITALRPVLTPSHASPAK